MLKESMTAEEADSLKLKCLKCPKEFKYESERRRHELSHSPQFHCKVCSKKFSFISALRRHEKQHDRTGSVDCGQCGGKFRDEILLKRHMKYAHKGTYSCKKCSSSFNSEVALQTHIKSHRPEAERQFRCSFNSCNKTFNFTHHLKHHELTHTNAKQHFCNVCGKGFIQLHHLKTHIKTHDPENWLSCMVSNCNKKFRTEYAVKRHLATHKNKFDDEFSYKPKSPHYSLVKLKNTINDAVQDNKKYFTDISKSDKNEKDPNSQFNLKTLKQENNLHTNKMAKDMEIVTDCKTVLGSCLMNADSEGNDCLCVQMTHGEDEPYDLTPIAKRKYTSLIETKYDSNQNYYEGCECSSTCNINNIKYENVCNLKKDGEYPIVDYGVDGIVKLRDTFDIDIPKNIVISKDVSHSENKIKTVPYNSCKAILGKCIVSGSGTISENCLCAKMHIDELQVLAEEVQDIIPHPNDPQLGSFVI